MSKTGDIDNSISMPNYCDEPHSNLGTYTKKGVSAWTEVWSGSYCSKARFWLPRVAIWADFRYF